MRVIIAGSRTIAKRRTVQRAIRRSPFSESITEVVSGTCKGVDKIGEEWAGRLGIPVKRFPADWSKGRKAGPLRNREMAKYADALIAIWDGESRGTRSMIEEALREKLEIYVTCIRQTN